MASDLLLHPVFETFTSNLLNIAFGAIFLYATLRYVYNAYFHPASRFPGPRIAAVSNIWYAYHWGSGKYPSAVLKALEKYGELLPLPSRAEANAVQSLDCAHGYPGDVVRVAPNELVFITPEAFSDIYNTYTNGREHFPKNDFMDLGLGDDGITWERSPEKHHADAKRLAPAFSPKALRAKEPILHKYTDAFVEKMKQVGGREDGIELKTTTDWFAMDAAADLEYSREMHHLRDMKSSRFLDQLWQASVFITANQVFKKLPLLSPLKFLFVPPAFVAGFSEVKRLNEQALASRIERRGKVDHLDHFEQFVPADGPLPDKKEQKHIEVITGHLVVAGYEPIASQVYGTIMFSALEPQCLDLLVQEIRGAFHTYDDIRPNKLASLQFLHAALMETLRFTVLQSSGQARVSPGAMVDGHYIPKGVNVSYGFLAFTRSPRYFHDACSYRPQRWLPKDHPHWDPAFQNDATDQFHPFSQGPRSCVGMPLAWQQTKLFLAKVLWTFDVEMLPGQSIEFERDFSIPGSLCNFSAIAAPAASPRTFSYAITATITTITPHSI
ncbi:cytochrome P450 [Apiospora rasikravindrae]|uniref:Cytochrome P450 n=1 Tax=Apiospora rasikravindrae TaxID=990691 RepID=A0ABR1S0P9_9PEZI